MDTGSGPAPESEALEGGDERPLDCGLKTLEPGQHMPQPCPRMLRPIALVEVLMQLAESCVIEQHIDGLRKGEEPTNLGLGTPDAAALMCALYEAGRTTWRWHPRRDRMQTSCNQLIRKTPVPFDQHAWKRRGVPAVSFDNPQEKNIKKLT